MKIKKLLIVFFILFFLYSNKSVFASDPLQRPNNFIGIHILDTNELNEAASLVNASGGDWGYVTIPIQYTDRNLDKWQKFMDDASDKHVIPIIRIATSPLYSDTSVWRKPEYSDILDFANFLDSLKWPTKNRYVILFNEVNRFDEWGGESPSPILYSQLVSYAIDVFKSRSDDFYLILAGLDNAAPDSSKFMTNLGFIKSLIEFNPDAIKKIDAISSHSYPNPNFSDSPNNYKTIGVSTYKFETALINSLIGEKKKVFITETGWNSDTLSDNTIADYLKLTLSSMWGQDKDEIVAITPFLLNSRGGSFDKFSFQRNGVFTAFGQTLKNYPKSAGNPEIEGKAEIKSLVAVLGSKKYANMTTNKKNLYDMKISGAVAFYLKSIFGI